MGTTLLHKIRIVRHKEKAEKKLDALLESYKDGAEYMRTHGKVAVVVFFTTCVQRISYFAVTWFVYTALGGKGFSVLEIIMLQSFVSVCIDILPFPGGVGANEGFFVALFAPVGTQHGGICNASQQRIKFLCVSYSKCGSINVCTISECTEE